MENSVKKSLSLFLLTPFLVMGHVKNPEVVAGSATFENPNPQTQEIRAANKTAINCQSFHVGKDETVRFILPHAKDRVLCRVTGKEASLIEGHLEANGHLFLVNPNSIFFRETAQVNVHSLIASTLNIKDEDFVKGHYKFFLEDKNSAVVNKGQITAAQDVVFMAPQIVNRAVVKAVAGRVAFLGGDLITLNFEGDNLISFAVEGDLKTGFIEQAGQIDSGKGFLLKLNVADALIKSVVNANGITEATGMQVENGKVYLVAGSSITAPHIKIQAPLVQTAGDFKGAQKLEITANKELKWQGGYIDGKLGSTDVVLEVSNGLLAIEAPFGKSREDKVTVKTLTLQGQTIDQKGPIKTAGAIIYAADSILLGSDTHALNSSIMYKGPVTIAANEVKIASGRSKGDITFLDSLNADHPGRTLTIFNGNQSGSVSFKGAVGSKGPFNLSVETGKLSLSNLGDKDRAGIGKLQIKATHVDFFGSMVHANEQSWDSPDIHLQGGQLTTFITHGQPLSFTPASQVQLSPQTGVVFETHGGSFELSKLSGDHQQSLTVSTGHGESTIGECGGKLGHLQAQSRNIHISGKIDAGSIFMEAQEHINYATDPQGKTFQRELLAEGEVTLNAQRGMVGTEEFPIYVKSQGKLFVGSKSFVYVKGFCEGGYPVVYKKNPPPRTIFNGNETQFVVNEELFMAEEQELMSLAPDLSHIAPHGFIDSYSFIFRRAPIYYTPEEKTGVYGE